MALSLVNIEKTVAGEEHLKDINLNFESGKRYVILGRTLAGKTSLLRIMAGLDRPSSGQVIVGEKDVTGVSVRKRDVAMVYQQFINYPSLNIYGNIASPLRNTRMSKADIDERVRSIAAMLHIDPLLDRLPEELSGGQQQRTAIARSLILDPNLLLMDEPLGSLDAPTSANLQQLLLEINQEDGLALVLVTHSVETAAYLGQKILLLAQPPVQDPEVIANSGSGSEDFRETMEYQDLCQQLRSRLEGCL